MKRVLMFGWVMSLGVFTFSCGAQEQSGSKATVTKPVAVEAAAPVWLTSLEAAKTEAAKRKVPILADFTGSDWCGWCIRLDKEVFSTPVFRDYAGTNLVLLVVDFPRSKAQTDELKKQNEELSTRFGIEGFPTVLILNTEGKETARTGYREGGAEAYVAHLKNLIGGKSATK